MSVCIEIVDLSLAPCYGYLIFIDISSGEGDGLWNIGLMIDFVGLVENIADGVLAGGGYSVDGMLVFGGTAVEE